MTLCWLLERLPATMSASGIAPILLANTTDPTRTDAQERLLWAGLLLVVALLAGAAILAWIDRWRKRMTGQSEDPLDLLGDFRSSYERGELSDEEYRRICVRLGAKSQSPARPEPKAASADHPPAEGRTNATPSAE